MLPCLAAPTPPDGDGSQAAPLDLTDDDDEILEVVCAALDACVASASARLVEAAAAAALPLLSSSAVWQLSEREAGEAALRLARSLLTSQHPAVSGALHGGGYGVALCLSLLNAAGGTLPSYLHDELAATMRALYSSRPALAAQWVEAAVALPSLVHPLITDRTGQPPPNAEERATRLRNYTQVLLMMATHNVWDHFQTVLIRGVAVSEAADQE